MKAKFFHLCLLIPLAVIYFNLDFFKFLYTETKVIIWVVFCALSILFWVYKMGYVKESFAVIGSFYVAILIPILSTTEIQKNSLNSIRFLDSYNCNVARMILITEPKDFPNTVTLIRYITAPYYENSQVIYRNLGQEDGDRVVGSAAEMEGANSLITIIQSLASGIPNNNVTTQLAHYTQKLIDSSKVISGKLLCDI